jgi:TolB protein
MTLWSAIGLLSAGCLMVGSAPGFSHASPPVKGLIAFDRNCNIDVMRPDGSRQRNLTPAGANICWYGPAWSPDGKQIVFAGDPCSHVHCPDIYVENSDGTRRRRLTRIGRAESPAWSPDGTKIAFDTDCPDDCLDIYVMNADGSGIRRLTRHGAGTDPAWSPDGTTIAFQAWDTIDLINADGSHLRSLTPHTFEDVGLRPAWSPDGSKIAFAAAPRTTRRFAPYAIYVVNRDGSDLRRLNRGASAFNLAWAPSTEIAFDDGSESPTGIFVMRADGSGLRRLTAQDDSSPSWQPAAKR